MKVFCGGRIVLSCMVVSKGNYIIHIIFHHMIIVYTVTKMSKQHNLAAICTPNKSLSSSS